MTTYRAVCYQHLQQPFPVRADRLDAREDTASHIHTPGGHHVDILEVDLEPTEVEGFRAAGYARNELPKLIDAALEAMKRVPVDERERQAETDLEDALNDFEEIDTARLILSRFYQPAEPTPEDLLAAIKQVRRDPEGSRILAEGEPIPAGREDLRLARSRGTYLHQRND